MESKKDIDLLNITIMTTTTTTFSIRGFLMIFSIILFSSVSLAQPSDSDKYNELSTSLDGVFQIQMINNRRQPSYDTELLVKIKDDQQENERVSFFYKSNIRILILSKQEVQSGMKITDDQKIIYLNE